MKKSLHEILTYFWIPFIMGLVWYIFRDRHDIPLAIVSLIALSAIYIVVRFYLTHRKWWLLATIPVIAAGIVVYILVRPQGITLSINGEPVNSSMVNFTEGSVRVNPAPGSDGKYAKNTIVTLTATAGAGYDWQNWVATANDTSNPTTVIMSGSKQVTVTFESRFSLIIGNEQVIGSSVSFLDGSVSVSPAPGDDGKYTRNAVVTLTANADSGYDWRKWTSTDNDTSNPTTVTMSRNKQVTVIFELRFSLTIGNQLVVGSSVSFTEGSVSVSPVPGDDDKYPKDTIVTLTANPASGYGWKSWAGISNSTSNPTTTTISSDRYVIVTFEQRFR